LCGCGIFSLVGKTRILHNPSIYAIFGEGIGNTYYVITPGDYKIRQTPVPKQFAAMPEER
jgi:hypothetical protein